MQNIFNPVGPAARELATTGWLVVLLFSAISVGMWALILWVALRRRGSFETHLPWDAGGGKGWIVYGGALFPGVVLAGIFILTLRAMAFFPMGDNEMHAGPAQIRIDGHQWWWGVEYRIGTTDQWVRGANEIHVPVGRPVDIDLESRDVIHSFWVPQLHGKVDLIPGITNRIRIQADQPGVFRGECAEYCGRQHAHMILIVVAQPQAEFDAWLGRERQGAAVPASTEALAGQALFVNGPCAMCHTVRGTGAQGRVGPDLTHVGGRRAIAGNMLVNDTANVEAWITHAQSLKPGARMPNITAFTGEQLRALTAYVRGLN